MGWRRQGHGANHFRRISRLLSSWSSGVNNSSDGILAEHDRKSSSNASTHSRSYNGQRSLWSPGPCRGCAGTTSYHKAIRLAATRARLLRSQRQIDLDMRLPFQILSERFYLPRPWLMSSCWPRQMTECALLQHGRCEDLWWCSKRTRHRLCKRLFSTFPASSSTSPVSSACSIVK